MYYVIDKATNRVVHGSDSIESILVDDLSYLIEADTFKFSKDSINYVWDKVNEVFKNGSVARPPTIIQIPIPKATNGTKRLGTTQSTHGTVVHEMMDPEEFKKSLIESELRAKREKEELLFTYG